MALQYSIAVPNCAGVNHIDFAIDGRYLIATCEFQGSLVKVDLVDRRVLGYLRLAWRGMPQDIRVSPDGQTFYVADMMAGGVHLVDGARFVDIGFIPTGPGTHGLYPSRDGTKLYVANRGSRHIRGRPRGPGSVAVIDFATRRVETTWPVPGGGSPDMGNVSADGRTLWLSGRFDDVVYAFDTQTGRVTTIPVGEGAARPHRLAAAGPLLARPHRQHAVADREPPACPRRGAGAWARGRVSLKTRQLPGAGGREAGSTRRLPPSAVMSAASSLNARSRDRFTRSGPSSSVSVVDPTTSTNSAVTTRRSNRCSRMRLPRSRPVSRRAGGRRAPPRSPAGPADRASARVDTSGAG